MIRDLSEWALDEMDQFRRMCGAPGKVKFWMEWNARVPNGSNYTVHTLSLLDFIDDAIELLPSPCIRPRIYAGNKAFKVFGDLPSAAFRESVWLITGKRREVEVARRGGLRRWQFAVAVGDAVAGCRIVPSLCAAKLVTGPFTPSEGHGPCRYPQRVVTP
jgi:hypothetical protein